MIFRGPQFSKKTYADLQFNKKLMWIRSLVKNVIKSFSINKMPACRKLK